MRECEEELPPKTPKTGSNMLIAYEESSNGQEQDIDDDIDEEDGQYERAEGNQNDGEELNDDAAGSTDHDTESEDEGEDIEGQFKDEDY